jgi:hypothetical protein
VWQGLIKKGWRSSHEFSKLACCASQIDIGLFAWDMPEISVLGLPLQEGKVVARIFSKNHKTYRVSQKIVMEQSEYCGYTTLRARNRQIWKCVWPKNMFYLYDIIMMSYKNVLYDLNTKFSTKFSTSTTSVYTQL